MLYNLLNYIQNGSLLPAMTRLRDFPWWPTTWTSENGGLPNPTEIRKTAVLKKVRRSGDKLVLILEHNGGICSAQIGSQLSVDFLILLRRILLQHCGKAISAVENCEIDVAALG